MGQPAYDRNAVRRRRAPQPQRKANLRVAKGGKRRLNPLQAAVHNAMNLVAAALLVGFCHQPAVERGTAGGAERPDPIH